MKFRSIEAYEAGEWSELGSRGSVTRLTDSAGAVIEKYKYDVFGAPIFYNGSGSQISGTAYGNPLLFTGRRYQAGFGFYEYRARAYHPGLGRFMSEDPEAQSMFKQLTHDGKTIDSSKYPGTLVELPGGGTVGMRTVASKSGPETVATIGRVPITRVSAVS